MRGTLPAQCIYCKDQWEIDTDFAYLTGEETDYAHNHGRLAMECEDCSEDGEASSIL